MNLTIVIPSYNSAPGLHCGLEHLAHQRLPAEHALQVIVVNDGSSDDTAEVVERFAARVPGLTCVFRPRDALSCRSRARNLGVSRATGEVLTFLDAGVLVGPDFSARVLERYASGRGPVLVHLVHGLLAPAGTEPPTGLSPTHFDAALARVASLPEWFDLRTPLFEQVEDDLDRLPGAWALGWTAALSVPRALFDRVGGFDEDFLRWGDEDCDFVHRLWQQGASLRAERQAVALHLPHPLLDDAPPEPEPPSEPERFTASRKLLHRKRHGFESELFIHCWNSIVFPRLLRRLEQLVLVYELPPYAPTFNQWVASRYVGSGASLLLGTDHPWLTRQFPVTHVAVHNQVTLRKLREAFPDRTLLHTLCLDTPFEDGAFDTAIVTDFLRLLGPSLQQAMLGELSRIARNVLFMCVEEYSPFTAALGFGFSRVDEVRAAAARAGLRLQPEPGQQSGGPTLFRLLPSPERTHA